MKRVLSLRNSIVITAILLGVFFSSSSFTFGLVQEVQLVENGPQKKEHFDILIQHGDSGMKKHMRRIIHFDDHDSIISLNDCIGDELRPPLPPMPPYPPFVIHKRFGGDPFAIDLKDESIISYNKKDIGKGMEKITIIRKKQQ